MDFNAWMKRSKQSTTHRLMVSLVVCVCVFFCAVSLVFACKHIYTHTNNGIMMQNKHYYARCLQSDFDGIYSPYHFISFHFYSLIFHSLTSLALAFALVRRSLRLSFASSFAPVSSRMLSLAFAFFFSFSFVKGFSNYSKISTYQSAKSAVPPPPARFRVPRLRLWLDVGLPWLVSTRNVQVMFMWCRWETLSAMRAKRLQPTR